jgi:hypothetical protein
MVNVPDEIRLGKLVSKAARALADAGMEHRIDIYRDIEIEDPVILKMLGCPHRVRVRIKITARSLLFLDRADAAKNNVVALPRTLPKGIWLASDAQDNVATVVGKVPIKSAASA